MGSTFSAKKKSIFKSKQRQFKRKRSFSSGLSQDNKYDIDTMGVNVKFICSNGDVIKIKPKYSYTYKGVPGGFYM